MKKAILLAVAVCLVAVSPRESRAWNGAGHMTVAEVAWEMLDAETRDKVTDVLSHHPYKEHDLKWDDLPGESHDRTAFALAATWPDLIKHFDDDPDPFHPFYAEFAKEFGQDPDDPSAFDHFLRGWHFRDVTIEENKEKTALALNEEGREALKDLKPAAGVAQVRNAFQAVDWGLGLLKDEDAAPALRAIALCWVVHLVGDLHQPLHCARLVSDQFKHGDVGGNLFLVTSAAGKTNLHSFWDASLGTSQFPPAIEKSARRLLSIKNPTLQKFVKGGPETDILDLDVAHWIDWGSTLAMTRVYQYHDAPVPAESSPKKSPPPLPSVAPVPGVPTPPSYEKDAAALASARGAIAGRRLAELLKQNLK